MSIETCPVCEARDPDCAFCLGLGQVSGAWRENFDQIEQEGYWTARIKQGERVLHRVVRREDIP